MNYEMINKHILVTPFPLDENDLQKLHQLGVLVQWNEMQIPSIAEKIEAMFCTSTDVVDESLLNRLPNLRVVSNYSVGCDNVDLQAAKKRNVAVGYCPGSNVDAVADFAFGLLMSCARQITLGVNYSKQNTDFWLQLTNGVSNKTLGIIGMGTIGLKVAERSLGFRMPVIYHNRRRKMTEIEDQVKASYCHSLDDLLRRSDYVVITASLTAATTNLISDRELKLMKKDAVLVNVARGKIIDHDALVEALENGAIRGAALDVTEPEPLPLDHKLLHMDNVIITPHMAWATYEAKDDQFAMAIDNIAAGLKGEDLPYGIVVD